MKSICSKCNIATNQLLIAEKKVESSGNQGWWEDKKYQIIQCHGCDSITFRILTNNPQIEYFAEQENIEHQWRQELFPARTTKTILAKRYKSLPPIISEIYKETIEAINKELFILSGAGVRALIEAICNDKAVSPMKHQRSLNEKLKSLVQNGYTTDANAKILSDIKLLGNKALHEFTEPTFSQLKTAIEIIENILDNIYEIPIKAKNITIQS